MADVFHCPECGADLSKLDPRKHALAHWNELIPDIPEYQEARRRQKILFDEAAKRKLEAVKGGS